jgi:hypothetical protein
MHEVTRPARKERSRVGKNMTVASTGRKPGMDEGSDPPRQIQDFPHLTSDLESASCCRVGERKFASDLERERARREEERKETE